MPSDCCNKSSPPPPMDYGPSSSGGHLRRSTAQPVDSQRREYHSHRSLNQHLENRRTNAGYQQCSSNSSSCPVSTTVNLSTSLPDPGLHIRLTIAPTASPRLSVQYLMFVTLEGREDLELTFFISSSTIEVEEVWWCMETTSIIMGRPPSMNAVKCITKIP